MYKPHRNKQPFLRSALTDWVGICSPIIGNVLLIQMQQNFNQYRSTLQQENRFYTIELLFEGIYYSYLVHDQLLGHFVWVAIGEISLLNFLLFLTSIKKGGFYTQKESCSQNLIRIPRLLALHISLVVVGVVRRYLNLCFIWQDMVTRTYGITLHLHESINIGAHWSQKEGRVGKISLERVTLNAQLIHPMCTYKENEEIFQGK